VSSFLSHTWAGESQWLIKDNGDPLYYEKRWDPNYEINMDIIKNIFDIYFDKNKTVFVEKSPPTICRAQKFQDYFSQFGEVYFIISIRDPYSTKYSAERWVEYAKYQKKNIETLKNTILTRYEDICVNLDQFILRIKNNLL
jgi:RNA recognition motif-containing protein